MQTLRSMEGGRNVQQKAVMLSSSDANSRCRLEQMRFSKANAFATFPRFINEHALSMNTAV